MRATLFIIVKCHFYDTLSLITAELPWQDVNSMACLPYFWIGHEFCLVMVFYKWAHSTPQLRSDTFYVTSENTAWKGFQTVSSINLTFVRFLWMENFVE